MTASKKKIVTEILVAVRQGDKEAASRLWDIVYDELRELASIKLAKTPPGQTLQPTALVHEAYLRLVDTRKVQWENRAHFFGAAARAMRNVLVDHARARRAEKRGGGGVRVTIGEADRALRPFDVVELDDVLERLRNRDERAGRAVELHYFGGLSYVEISEALGVSEATVDRDMRFARAWLRRALEPRLAKG